MSGSPFELWPYHPKPLPDELLSSWLVRIAHGHRLKVQTFSEAVFGREHQLWNRDIDRLAPSWLVDRLSIQTGITLADAYQTTLRAYRTRLYRQLRESGVQQWILPLDMYHRKHLGHGLQFCPACLADDAEPYFRKRWRVAFYTFCARHNAIMLDCCPECGEGVAFHRIELGKYGSADSRPTSLCHHCGFDFRETPVTVPEFYEVSAFNAMNEAMLRLEQRGPRSRPRGVRYYNVLHHLCWLLTARYRRVTLLDYVHRQTGVPALSIQSSRVPFEARPIQERHHLVQLAFWLLADLEPRLTAAWKARTVTYSALLRDFHDRPDWYDRVVGRFSDWRKGLGNN